MTGERIGSLINQLPQLQGLSRQLRQIAILQSVLADVLPAGLVSSTAVAASTAGELVLFAENGAVAAKLRQLTPRILVFFRQRGVEVTGIRIQVQVSIRHNPLPQKQISLGPGGRQAIAKLASQLERSPLKDALERLGSRAQAASDHDGEPLKRI